MKLVIYSELSRGGIADYAHDQAAALQARGFDVDFICAPDFLEGRQPTYRALPILRDLRSKGAPANPIARKLDLAGGILNNWRVLLDHVQKTGARHVLTHFSEYLAPIWAPWAKAEARRGVKFYSVLHDPVRDYVLGPKWWHDWSVRAACEVLTGGFVHAGSLAPLPGGAWVKQIPYGLHPYPAPSRPRAKVREELDLPADARVLIAFGYIRDNKNLDLVIDAMAGTDLYLVVAGTEQAGGNRPMSFYQERAQAAGVAGRCRWVNRFLSNEEVADLIGACDLSVLTYSRSFVSASAAMSVTVSSHTPAIFSSGSEAMRQQVEEYGIGVWVEPDSTEAIREGLERWRSAQPKPAWDRYQADNSWTRNAQLIKAAIEESAA